MVPISVLVPLVPLHFFGPPHDENITRLKTAVIRTAVDILPLIDFILK